MPNCPKCNKPVYFGKCLFVCVSGWVGMYAHVCVRRGNCLLAVLRSPRRNGGTGGGRAAARIEIQVRESLRDCTLCSRMSRRRAARRLLFPTPGDAEIRRRRESRDPFSLLEIEGFEGGWRFAPDFRVADFRVDSRKERTKRGTNTEEGTRPWFSRVKIIIISRLLVTPRAT